jgi:hypothetical protein
MGFRKGYKGFEFWVNPKSNLPHSKHTRAWLQFHLHFQIRICIFFKKAKWHTRNISFVWEQFKNLFNQETPKKTSFSRDYSCIPICVRHTCKKKISNINFVKLH